MTLPSVGLITAQRVAGAISTGTHGSGKSSLSHYVQELRVATYDPVTGEPVIRTIREGAELRAARCALGTLGVILSVTFDCRSTYNVEEVCRQYDDIEGVLAEEAVFPLQQFYLVPWSWCFFGQHRRETTRRRSWDAWHYRLHWWIGTDVGLHLILLYLVRISRSRQWIRSFYEQFFPRLIVQNWKVV